MLGSGVNLITTVIGFGLSATFIVFICTRLIWGRIQRMRSRQRFDIVTRINLEQPDHWINCVESGKDSGVATMQFSREILNSTKDTVCTICLAEYQDKETLRIMPKCGHIFHLLCIDIWLRKHSTCPICRLSIQDSGRAKYTPSPAMLSTSVTFNGSEISSEHQQWQLPMDARIGVDATDQTRGGSVSGIGIELGSRRPS